uniref:Bowman-Birk serine protease inhibitors family domain-containing protein n=1 Tax=Aegilops tauschii TaxID=37682 RepID=M8B999_AEGTA
MTHKMAQGAFSRGQQLQQKHSTPKPDGTGERALSEKPSGYFPKCCDNCRSFSGIDVGDDAHPECPKGCLQCRVVQTSPAKTFRCADYRGDSDDTCGPPCKKN